MAQVQVVDHPVLTARQTVIDELRELLVEAEAGRLVGIAYAYVTQRIDVVRGWAAPGTTQYPLIAGLYRCARELEEDETE